MSSPSGWLTDKCIRKVVMVQGKHDKTSRIHFVDPSWFKSVELDNKLPDEYPDFLIERTTQGIDGLAIPYAHDNVHWAVFYFDLKKWKALHFCSVRSPIREAQAEVLIRKFADLIKDWFVPKEELWFKADTYCAQQEDGSACGIYACITIIDLLDHRRPGSELLTKAEIKNFRENVMRIFRRWD